MKPENPVVWQIFVNIVHCTIIKAFVAFVHHGHDGRPRAADVGAERPEFAFELAVKGMLPKNALGRTCLTRLHLYKGDEHPHAAQKPEAWTQV